MDQPNSQPDKGRNAGDPVSNKVIAMAGYAHSAGLTRQFAIRSIQQHRDKEDNPPKDHPSISALCEYDGRREARY
jgi:hypothetical protein